MDLSLAGLLRALTLPGAASLAVEAILDVIKPTLADADQQTLQDALADVRAENDEGHARLQEKLAAAAQR